MQIVINNILTHYISEGQGPVIVFLHGWGDEGKTFAPLIKSLKKNHTCIALDLPGFGGTHAPSGVWGIPEYADFIRQFLVKTKLKPVAVVGHSNGGTIALYGLSRQLIDAKKLVLLASAGIRSEEGVKKSLYKIVAKVGKQATRVLPPTARQKLRRKLYSSAGSDIFVAPHLEETFKKVVSYDAQEDAAAVTQPALLIYAQDDTETPPRYGQKLNTALTSAKLEILPDGGHFLHHTQTTVVLKKLEGFLK